MPNVRAGSAGDAWFGVGYAVAQDRLVELELFRRSTQGRLAEVLGESRLESDIVARRDYYTPKELRAQLAKLPASLRARFDAYAEGVNAWIARVAADPSVRPREFALLNLTPAPWTELDSAAIGVQLARTVPSDDGRELDNWRALRSLGAKRFAGYLPLRRAGTPTTVPASKGRFPSQPGRSRSDEKKGYKASQKFLKGLKPPKATATVAHVAGRLPARGGSFHFALRGAGNTASLFSAPQLGFSIPELFVEYEVHAPGLDVRGVTGPGIPVVAAGHNGRIAWGITSGLGDDDDLYVEKLAGKERYRFKGKTRKMSCRNETFKVSGAKSVKQSLLPHRPRAGAADAGQPRLRAPLRDLGPRDADVRRARRAQRREHGAAGRQRRGEADVEREPAGRRRRRPHRLVASRPAAAAPEALGRAAAVPRHRRGRVARAVAGQAAPEGDRPAPGLPRQLEQPAVGRLDPRRRRRAGDQRGRPAPRRVPAAGAAREHRPLARRPEGDRAPDRHDRPAAVAARRTKLQAAQAAASGPARTVLDTILAWDGNYDREDAAGTVDPGVAAFEALKSAVKATLPKAAVTLLGERGGSHPFDMGAAEAAGFHSLGTAGLVKAAGAAQQALAEQFGSADPATWREPRKLYKVQVQGVASAPRLEFFDRGTFSQAVELGP